MSSKIINQDLGTCIYTPLPVLPVSYKSNTVPLATLIKMSSREHHLRLKDEAFQTRFKTATRDGFRGPDGTILPVEEKLEEQSEIIIEIQHQVLMEFGYAKELGKSEETGAVFYSEIDEMALYEMRTAAFQYPEESSLQETVYFKHNRAGDIPLEDGDVGKDCALFELDSRKEHSLFSYLAIMTPAEEEDIAAVKAAGGDTTKMIFPRVVVSGSYTWPPLRALVSEIETMAAQEFASQYIVPGASSSKSSSEIKDESSSLSSNTTTTEEEKATTATTTIQGTTKATPWSLVYIMEAHAADGWRMGQPRDVNQHKNLEDRYREAKQFREDLSFTKIPMMVDSWSTPCGNPSHGFRCGSANFERLYGAWPTRVFIFDQHGRLLMKGMPNKAEVDMAQLARGIKREFEKPQQCC